MAVSCVSSKHRFTQYFFPFFLFCDIHKKQIVLPRKILQSQKKKKKKKKKELHGTSKNYSLTRIRCMSLPNPTMKFYLEDATPFIIGPRQAKNCLRACAKCADSHHPAHAQDIIWAFALHLYILQYPLMLLAGSEGPDQTEPFRNLI